jgi:hypothetical protein
MSDERWREMMRNMAILSAHVSEELAKGRSQDQIATELSSKGISQDAARELVKSASLFRQSSPAEEATLQRALRKDRGKRRTIRGCAWLLLGVCITSATYLIADRGNTTLYVGGRWDSARSIS